MNTFPETSILHRDLVSGLILVFEGNTFATPALSMFMRDTIRYKDIGGKDIGQVMEKTGWHGADAPVCISAYERDEDGLSKAPYAAAWCMPITWRDGRSGINLSYATDKKHAGHGLSKLLSSAAFLCFDEEHMLPDDVQVNIQTDTENQASIGIAKSMGFSRAPENDFSVPAIDQHFLAYSMSCGKFRRYAIDTCAQRIECHGQAQTAIERDQPRSMA